MPAPGKAQLSYPLGANDGDTSPTYQWSDVPNATWYYLWVDGPSGNVVKRWVQEGMTAGLVCNGTTCSYNAGVTLRSGAHKWWIQTWGPGGYGPWSDEGPFTVGP